MTFCTLRFAVRITRLCVSVLFLVIWSEMCVRGTIQNKYLRSALLVHAFFLSKKSGLSGIELVWWPKP